ncbi:thermonuclease family protein [Marinovum sp. 2_MG-2023]|nr:MULTISPECIES: thermonuclease family protein [unclassified Marinovum]MDO6728586.1 thermonuclease family protein [Marinovum sp. 2_MG-2023]MDO6777998.1 thermonuclease family protein [Marinovum sp. 1_MG-2023]
MLRICSRLVPAAAAALICACAGLATAVAAAPAEVSGTARVIDGDTLDVADRRIRLFGIDAVEKDQTCRHPVDGDWPCGREVTRQVAVWLDGKTLHCVPQSVDRYGRQVAICTLDGQDVGRALVRAGLAFAYKKYSTLYASDERRALAAGRGLWTSVVVRPDTHRAAARPEPQIAPKGCQIKGNIASDGTRIYHMPGQAFYANTRISPKKGEHWFCTEAAARKAGWRRARR